MGALLRSLVQNHHDTAAETNELMRKLTQCFLQMINGKPAILMSVLHFVLRFWCALQSNLLTHSSGKPITVSMQSTTSGFSNTLATPPMSLTSLANTPHLNTTAVPNIPEVNANPILQDAQQVMDIYSQRYAVVPSLMQSSESTKVFEANERWTSAQAGESLDGGGNVSWGFDAGTTGPTPPFFRVSVTYVSISAITTADSSFQQDLILGACNDDLTAAGGFDQSYKCINPH
jgi:hypothetical protein